jgi:hypothetical protein
MKPPICELCGQDFRDTSPLPGALVRFADYEPLSDGMVGHPQGLAWFCGEHVELARSLGERPLSEALKIMGSGVQ